MNATDKPIRWGILGAGLIAHKLAEAVLQDRDSVLLAVASSTPGKAEAFASEYGIEAAADYQDLVSNPDIDVVYIATTHNFHHDNALLVLRHSKHCLVEKAFTVNADQARKLVALAREQRCFLMEAMWTRFLPSMLRLRQEVDSARIGSLQHLSLTFGGFVPDRYRNRVTSPELAGGVTLDMGIYPISFLCYVLRELPVETKSTARMSSTGVDELAMYQFRFPSGVTASVSTSYNLLMKSEAMLYGTLGYIDFPSFQKGNTFSINIHGGTGQIEEIETVVVNNPANGFSCEVQEVVRCLRSGRLESDIMPLDESVGIMALIDGMRAEWGFRYPFE